MENENRNRPVRIILVGFMGSGKTTVGKGLAKELGIPFLDTDDMIEKEEGRTISEIFAQDGQEYFRDAETALLTRLSGDQSIGSFLLSCGGGIVLREENRTLLKETGLVVLLSCSIDTYEKRLSGDTVRPNLRGEGTLREKISRLLSEREEYYRDAADVVIQNDFDTPLSEICESVKKILKDA